MQNKIAHLKQKSETFNKLRFERALSVMDDNARNVMAVLPLLLHFNDPKLPAFVDGDVPTGIHSFSLSERQQHYLSKLNFQTPSEHTLTTAPIYSLFTMGSTGSLGQNWCSDFDIWVCHASDLSSENIKLLDEKCHLIMAWAEALGVEVTLFLIGTQSTHVITFKNK